MRPLRRLRDKGGWDSAFECLLSIDIRLPYFRSWQASIPAGLASWQAGQGVKGLKSPAGGLIETYNVF